MGTILALDLGKFKTVACWYDVSRVACFRRSFATTENPASARRKHAERQVAHLQSAHPFSLGNGSIAIGTGLIPA
jgi:hypothetical protein